MDYIDNDMTWDILGIVMIGIILVTVLSVLTGCTNEPLRQYNSEDNIDVSCYGTYGAALGYCVATREYVK